ncbi:MAG: thioredoxin-disulfide reductase [Candidatus Krumholzibacteria bacterium]|nr:thioredoxin-disulfide reductase [Candidatus Krumholzibacteria bacterium]
MSDQKEPKVIIVGSGPAGYTAGIYLGRANIPNLLFEGEQPGGQLTITTEVENYPAFPDGIDGPELMMKFRAQAERFGTVVKGETVKSVDMSSHPFKVTTNAGEYVVPAVIIASGSTARWLGLPGEEEFFGKGLSACATCDGFFFRDQEVAVVGGGDTALEEAIYLTNFATKVTLVHRRDELRGSKIMQDRALAHPKIEMAWNSTIDKYVPDDNGNLVAVTLLDTVNGEKRDLAVSGCFIAIGHTPNTQFLDGQLTLDENGYLITTPDRTSTKVAGIFACGDVQDHFYRQAITSAGTGCMAAMEAERWLGENGL